MTGSPQRHWGVDLPADWRVGQVKHAGRITLGKMLQSEGEVPDKAPYLRAANVQPNGVLALEDVKEMFFSAGELQQLSLTSGDVVVVEGGQGGYGRAALVRENLAGWGFQNSIMRLRPAGSDGRFLAYYLIAARERGYIQAICNVVSMPHYTSEKLAATPVPLPPELEQVAVADYLDRETAQIDGLIGKQERLIETLRERQLALVEKCFAELKLQWPEIRVGRDCAVGNGSTPSRDRPDYWADRPGTPWLNSGVVNRDRVTDSDQYVTSRALDECHLPRVYSGSVLVGLTGQGKTRGMATLLHIDAVISQHVAFVTPRSGRWNPEFLTLALRARYRDLRRLSDENGSTKGGLTCADLKAVRLAQPSLAIQAQIVEHLSVSTRATANVIEKAEDFIALARERRSALITAAVTGQIDVRTAA